MTRFERQRYHRFVHEGGSHDKPASGRQPDNVSAEDCRSLTGEMGVIEGGWRHGVSLLARG